MAMIDWGKELVTAAGNGNKRRLIKPISNVDQRQLNESVPIYIYTTYCQDHHIFLGIFGQYFLKGVDTHGFTNGDDWEPYRLATTLKSRIVGYDMDSAGAFGPMEAGIGAMKYDIYDGLDIAADLLKRNEQGDTNLENWGVFASMHNPPLQEEIKLAKTKLHKKLEKVVHQADQYNRGTIFEQKSIGMNHRNAANYLKVARDWAKETEVLISCPYCTTAVREDCPICPTCHKTINQVLLEEIDARIQSKAKKSKV